MMNAIFPGALSLLAMVNFGPVQDHEFVRRGSAWFRVDPTGTYRVNPQIISLRLLPDVDDPGILREAAAGTIPELELVRSNCLDILDLRVPEGHDVLEVVAAVRATGLVEFVSENTFGEWFSDPDDPEYPDQWALKNTGQSGGLPDADIDADLAWDLESGLPGVVVAVIDSGTEISHEDLAANIWTNPGEIPNNNIDDDSNGFIDDVVGWDFHLATGSVWDWLGHGTSVAGVAGATTNNGKGVAGVAGGFGNGGGCRLMTLKIGDFSVDSSVIDDAIIYATNNGAQVINISLGVSPSTPITQAILYAHYFNDVFIVAAPGNSGGAVGFPASLSRVVSVAATDAHDTHASFSNSGPENWIAAPGVQIRMPDIGNGYHSDDGTSFSAPHVAGVAALLYSALPNLDNESLQEILKITADDIGSPGFDNDTGWGRLNARAAVQHALDNDCNGNGAYDPDDIASGTSSDSNGNGIPDECECAPPSNFCLTAPNSVGSGAIINSSGSQSVSVGAVTLQATGCPPGEHGIFYYGPNMTQTPFGNGFRCVNGALYRLPVITIDGGGSATMDWNISTAPNPGGIQPGDVWHFQYWYRDPLSGGPSTFNLSDGRTIPFCP